LPWLPSLAIATLRVGFISRLVWTKESEEIEVRALDWGVVEAWGREFIYKPSKESWRVSRSSGMRMPNVILGFCSRLGHN
jgi:hypothetical protein